MDELKVDALKRATIAMCDAEVIFQILMEKGLTTKEEILEWRRTVSKVEPYYTLFRNLEQMKKTLREEKQAELNTPVSTEDSKQANDKSLLRIFNNMMIKKH